MPRKIIYIVNPISGTGKKERLQGLIEEESCKRNISYRIFPSVASGDYSFLKSIIKEEKITDVVIAGGDGTVSAVVGSLLNEKLNFGVIPCGSGNGLALAAGISKQHRKAIETVFAGKPQRTDGFMVNEKFACMLCGLGFDAKVAQDFSKQSKRGLKTYVKEVLRNFFTAKTFPFELRSNNRSLKVDAYLFSIANSNQFGNRVTIAPKASLSDGLLDVIIITHQNKISLLFQTLKQLAGKNKLQTHDKLIENKAVIYFQTDSLLIRNPGEAPIHIDGDPCNMVSELKIKVLPGCFNLIRP